MSLPFLVDGQSVLVVALVGLVLDLKFLEREHEFVERVDSFGAAQQFHGVDGPLDGSGALVDGGVAPANL